MYIHALLVHCTAPPAPITILGDTNLFCPIVILAVNACNNDLDIRMCSSRVPISIKRVIIQERFFERDGHWWNPGMLPNFE